MPGKRFGDLVYEIAEAVLRVECLTLHEISAYVGLNFLACYLYGTLVAYPGGNGHIVSALVHALRERSGVTFSTESKVIRIELSKPGRTVTYQRGNKCFVVRAKVVIFAAPKFIAAQTIPDMPDDQREAIGRMSYRGFAMATALLSGPMWDDYYGGYILEDQRRPVEQHAWCKGGAFVIPSWSTKGRSPHGFITLLKPIVDAQEQARLASTSFSELSNATRAELNRIIEAGGLSKDDIIDLKLWRWPKSIIAPTVGDLSDGIFERGRRLLEGLVFAGQDTYGLGNVDGAVNVGVDAARVASAGRFDNV
jgi:spermidine dehydrogenase